MNKIIISLVSVSVLAACSLFGKDPLDIEGERISVIRENRNLQPDYVAGELKIRLPKSELNSQWSQAGGNASHYMQHLKAGGNLDEIWDVSFGKGSSKRDVLITSPVSDGKNFYTLDSKGITQAYSLNDGEKIWRKRLKHSNKKNRDASIIGAGLAVYDGKLFATTGFGKVFALNAENGETLWEQDLKSPIRIAPTVDEDLVIVQTIDNAIYAIKINDGDILWKDKIESESTTMIGGAAPAFSVKDDLIVAAFSNGQLQAYKASTGTPLWSEWVISGEATDSIAEITSIRANPVIADGFVYAGGYSGPLVAIDIRTGVKVWVKDIAITSQPWVAGNFLFVLDNDGDLAAIERSTGKIVWSSIISAANSDKKSDIVIAGPILTNDALLVVTSTGKLYSISPYNGRIMGVADVDDDVETTPLMVNEVLLLTTKDAKITAYK